MGGMEHSSGDLPCNPLDPTIKLEQSSNSDLPDQTLHSQPLPTAEDSAVTKAEKLERHGIASGVEESPSKRRRVEPESETQGPSHSERRKGVTPIKKESVSSIAFYEWPTYDQQVPFAPSW